MILGGLILSILVGIVYYNFLNTRQPSRYMIHRYNVLLGLDMCLWGGLSFVFDGVLSTIFSFIVGLCFGCIILNKVYSNSLSQDQD